MPTESAQQTTPATLIGKGLTCEVFSYGEGRVIKLYHSSRPISLAHREFLVSQAVHQAGLPSPAVVEITQVGNRNGIVFEHVRGNSMLRVVELKPYKLFWAARLLAELHARVHASGAPQEIPEQHEQIERWIQEGDAYLTADQKATSRQLLAQLPPGNCLCHGDFHPANILMTATGPVIIDWSTGTRGHPLADMARTSVLFESARLPDDSPWHTHLLMKLSRQLLHATYLKRYLKLRGGTLEEIEKWRVLQRLATTAIRAKLEIYSKTN
jgi:uncharacterized protein (TIGR02172 family)